MFSNRSKFFLVTKNWAVAKNKDNQSTIFPKIGDIINLYYYFLINIKTNYQSHLTIKIDETVYSIRD